MRPSFRRKRSESSLPQRRWPLALQAWKGIVTPDGLGELSWSKASVTFLLELDRGTERIDPGEVFDLELPLAEPATGYEAMDQRRAIKVLLRP
jgi:hypothetical protein